MILVWAALASCFLIAIIAVFYALQLNKRLQLSEEQSQQAMQKLQHDLDVVNSAAMGVGQRLINAEKKLKAVIAKQQLGTSTSEQLPYNLAASFAETGAETDQLVERYGLPEAEASLLSLLKNRSGDAY